MGNASEMLRQESQEQSNDGAGPVLVIWDFVWPEAQFSRSVIIIYAASAESNTDQCL